MFLTIKKPSKVLATLLTIVALLTGQHVMAQVSYIVDSATDGNNDEQMAESLFDGDTRTKWCVGDYPNECVEEKNFYVTFHTSIPITPIGYVMTTGEDNEDFPGRNPKSWVIKAKANEDDDWTELHVVEDDKTMENKNITSYAFTFDNNNSYRYFRLGINKIEGYSYIDEFDYKWTVYPTVQLSEFFFLTATSSTDLPITFVDGLKKYYQYTGSSIDFGACSLKNYKGETIPTSDYTITFKNSMDEVVADVVDMGTYTMLISPSEGSAYTGTKSISFDVVPWCSQVGGYCGNIDTKENVYYEVTEEASVKTLTVRKNPVATSDDFNMMHNPTLPKEIDKVVIADGVTSIGERAFCQFDRIQEVLISSSVESIVEHAFDGCTNLKTVTIGSGVTNIENDAFYLCTNVTDVYCYANPNNLTWTDCWYDDFMESQETKCHVLPEYLNKYNENWKTGEFYVDVNVTFVGDLASPSAKENDGKYWSTFYNTSGYRIADIENACAYTATLENATLTLHKLGKMIPAGTAVILVGSNANINMIADNTSTAENKVGNHLKGVDDDTPIADLGTGTFYVLGKLNDSFGFYKYTGTNMPAHKAYLQVDSTSTARGFNMVFDYETTALLPVNSEKTTMNSEVYDLQGRKVSNPTKGLYIVNGRKVVIK